MVLAGARERAHRTQRQRQETEVGVDPNAPALSPKFTLPGYTNVQARFTRDNGDTTINTFTFERNTGVTDAMIKARLDKFYNGTHGTQAYTIRAMMTARVQTITYYMREADQPEGTPGREVAGPGPFSPDVNVAQLPPDLAIALSYRGAVGLTLPRRRRGRIFIGPLRREVTGPQQVIDGGGRINDLVRAAINQAAIGLSDVLGANGAAIWGIASRVGNEFTPIVRGFVDSDFDTQRRRDPGAQNYNRRPDTWFQPSA